MPFGDMGSKSARNQIARDQNDRAQESHDIKIDEFNKNAPIREQTRELAYAQNNDALLAHDADATSYGDEYNYGLELKRRLDEKRYYDNLATQMKAMKHANKAANISADMSDQAVIKYGVSGSDKDLSKVALHTSGNGQPNEQGFYQVGPYAMRPVRPENMSARQRQEMDRLRQNRQERLKAGIYKEETFADGVKRFVNGVSNEVFGQDIWLEDDQGKVYTPEHIKMITGQAERASSAYQATTPKAKVTPETKTDADGDTDFGKETPTEEKAEGGQGNVQQEIPEQPTDNSQMETPLVPEASASKPEVEDIGQKYADYEAQNPSFRKDMDKVTETVQSFPEGTAGAGMIKGIGLKGPEMDLKIKEAVEKYPTELANMSPEQFQKFYNEQNTAAPTTLKEAKEKEPLEERLGNFVSNYISQAENNANKPKGAQKADDRQMKFMEVANQPGMIQKAIKEGVTDEQELQDWVEKKGKFKPKTATQLKDEETMNISNNMIDVAYPKTDDEKTNGRFSTASLAKLSPKDAMKAQLKLGKPSDLKDMEKAYQGAEEWYNVRNTILSVSDKRLKLSEIGDSLATMSDKYFATFWDGDDGSFRFAQLEATMGKAVANQVKLMSGTAASDKERATILRYMFGDKGVTHESFLGAISGYTKMVEDNLPNQAETAFSKKGFSIARKFSALYEKHRGKSDPRGPNGGKETELERLKRIRAERQGGK